MGQFNYIWDRKHSVCWDYKGMTAFWGGQNQIGLTHLMVQLFVELWTFYRSFAQNDELPSSGRLLPILVVFIPIG